MEEGIFSEWLKPDGASVREGDELFTLESDKAVQGVPSLYDGILRIAPDGPQPGDVVAVGRILGHILAIGEELRVASPTQDAPRTTVAASNPVSASNPASTQRDPAANASHARARLRISPRARRAARELGLDPSQLQGSGQGGRIVERDVRALASRGASKVLHTSPARSIPNSAVRRRIAQRLRDGLQQTASVTLTTKVDASQLHLWHSNGPVGSRDINAGLNRAHRLRRYECVGLSFGSRDRCRRRGDTGNHALGRRLERGR